MYYNFFLYDLNINVINFWYALILKSYNVQNQNNKMNNHISTYI